MKDRHHAGRRHRRFTFAVFEPAVFIRRSVLFAIAPGESGPPSESQPRSHSPFMRKNAAMRCFLTFLVTFF